MSMQRSRLCELNDRSGLAATYRHEQLADGAYARFMTETLECDTRATKSSRDAPDFVARGIANFSEITVGEKESALENWV